MVPLARPRTGVRRVAQLAMSVAVVALFAVMQAAPLGESSGPVAAVPACSEVSPCLPSPLLPIAIGALLAALFVAWISPWMGAVAGTVFIGSAVADAMVAQLPPADGVDVAVMAAFLAVMWLLAWVAERPRVVVADLTRMRPATSVVPEPVVPRVIAGRGLRTWLLAGAVASLVFGLWQQAAAEIRQGGADIVAAEVDAYVDDYTKVRLVLPGGGTADVPVVNVFDYPRHSTVDVYADGAGMVQLVAEPYDATAWFIPVSALVILGVAQHRRWRRRKSIWSRFFAAQQPTMRVWFNPDNGLIYPAEAAPEDPPLARVESAQWAGKVGSGLDADPVFPGQLLGTVYGDFIDRGPLAFAADDLPIVTGHFRKARHRADTGFVSEDEALAPGEDRPCGCRDSTFGAPCHPAG